MQQGESQVGLDRSFRREHDVALFLANALATAISRASERRSRFQARSAQVVGGGKTPTTPGKHADPNASRLGTGNLPRLAIFGGEIASWLSMSRTSA